MRIDFNIIKEIVIPCLNDGIGTMSAYMYNDEKYHIILTSIHAGGCMGQYKQGSGDDLNYVLSGSGKAICNDEEELLVPRVMHICPQGSEHSIVNISDEGLVMLTIVAAR